MYSLAASRRAVFAASTIRRRALTYQKADGGHTTEPEAQPNGALKYTVSSPAPEDAEFGAVGGAFQSQTTPETGPTAAAPQHAPHSSTSASPAHPTTTRQAADGTLASRNAQPKANTGSAGGRPNAS